jgi:hypothetical protein
MVRAGVAMLSLLAACHREATVGDPDPLIPVDSDALVDEVVTVPVTGTPPAAAPFQDTGASVDRLLAGAWTDLEDWPFWLGLLDLDDPWYDLQTAWGFDTSQRLAVTVLAGQAPVVDAEVRATYRGAEVWQARTDQAGHADLFPGLFDGQGGPWDLTVVRDGLVLQQFSLQAVASPPRVLVLDDAPMPPSDEVDLLWAIDTRRSQDHELDWLQTHLPDLLSTLHEALSDERLPRYGLTLFGDGALTTSPLQTDPDAVLSALQAADAVGSGETSLAPALAEAAARDWSTSARLRVLFLVLGTTTLAEEELASVHASIQALAARGVRVVAVGTSPSLSTSFLLRNVTIATHGAWWFLLDQGPPEQSRLVGAYQTDDLDTHMLRWVLDAADLP